MEVGTNIAFRPAAHPESRQPRQQQPTGEYLMAQPMLLTVVSEHLHTHGVVGWPRKNESILQMLLPMSTHRASRGQRSDLKANV